MAGADGGDSEENCDYFVENWELVSRNDCQVKAVNTGILCGNHITSDISKVMPDTFIEDFVTSNTEEVQFTSSTTNECLLDCESELCVAVETGESPDQNCVLPTEDNETPLSTKGNSEIAAYTLLPRTLLPRTYSCSLKKKKTKKTKKRTAQTEDNKEKSKKWRRVDIEEYGFYPSLFPRPTQTAAPDEMEICPEDLCYRVETEFDVIERKLTNSTDFELYQAVDVKEIRADRDRKVQKASKQVKDKYCKSVKNNHGKKLFVHHRVFKIMELEPRKISFLPNPEKVTQIRDTVKELKTNARTKKEKTKCDKGDPPVAAETRHALHSSNAPSAIAADSDLVNLLISLQHRDLSPEDYDLLLRLDEQVAPKTLSQKTLQNFKTEIVTEADYELDCAICMEKYTSGDVKKYLPCEHFFHSNCIDMWLNNSSLNCPLDGLPVEQ